MATLTLAICARNAEDIIGDCLESIRIQTVPPDEIIVAVDEHSDPTSKVAQAYGARVIASHGTGLYEARNAVLDACTTDYLAFTDADCVLVPGWVDLAKQALDAQPAVAAGTGRHPPVGAHNVASWLHHMWYVVEATNTGETQHVIGGNSYFRTDALREVGGWLNLPDHSAAEDMYISEALRRAGHRIWFEEGAAAQHHYEKSLEGLWKKSVMMGRDIVVMMRATGWRGRLWWYTLSIPLLAIALAAGIVSLPFAPGFGMTLTATTLLGSLAYLSVRFRSIQTALPRWVARWVLIAPYSYGVIRGSFTRVPGDAARHRELRAPHSNRGRTKVGLVCSHGGHLTEMLELQEAFADYDTFYFSYDGETTRRLPNAYLVPNRPYSPLRFVANLYTLIRIYREERPDFIVSTGAEIAVPAFLIAKALRIPTLYVECGAQVTQPSLTGRIVIRLADRFFVQWRELLAAYGRRAEYRGSLVDEAPLEDAA